MAPLIRVLNPNSNIAMTASFSVALEPFRLDGGPEIDCVTCPDGPFGVASEDDVELASRLVAEHVVGDKAANALVIACYSDPGLAEARQQASAPVLGMAECAIASALSQGDRFGVLSVSDWSVARHGRHLEGLDLQHRCAGDRALGISVSETESGADTFARLRDIGRQLIAEDGADVLIMACAGFSKHRAALEAELGQPVIDPILAGVTQALGLVLAKA